jgi:SpoVK/Ycf46/Vps4 family AAA+-type ATPase
MILIDEIDSLVPDRTDKSNSSVGGNDLMSVILAVLDGAKIT